MSATLDRLGGVLLLSLLVAARSAWPQRGLDVGGAAALRDSLLSLGLTAAVLLIAAFAGRRILVSLALPALTPLESWVLAAVLGIGGIGVVFSLLALAGAYRPVPLWLSLLGLALLVGPGWSDLSRLPQRLRDAGKQAWQAGDGYTRLVACLSIAIALPALVHALGPAWDYDGLMYHLVGPREMLAAGGFVRDSDNWYVNGPFLLEGIYGAGLVFGDEVFAKLLHLATGALLVLATLMAGRRFVGERPGWVAMAILLGVPTLPIWSAFAYIDMGWSVFEFLALFAVLLWVSDHKPRWLVLAGLLSGFAAGSKYLGLAGLAVLGLAVVWHDRRRGWPGLVRDALALGLPAALVALPWYAKNLLWFGNPVYPLYFGGPGWDAFRLHLYHAYLNSYGVGRGLLNFLLLPWNVFARHEAFGAVMNRIDVPGFLFPLVLLYPLTRKRPLLTLLGWILLGRWLVWAAGSQQLRFLLPVYPALAVLAAHVVSQAAGHPRLPKTAQLFLPSLAAGMLVLTLFYQAIVLTQFKPQLPILGLETRRSYLTRRSLDFAAARFVVEQLPTDTRVVQLGDGRGFYCLPTCVPDPDHFRWAAEISRLPADSELTTWFAEQRFTHLLISLEDIDFLLQHDPQGVMRQALERLSRALRRDCQPVYEDPNSRVYPAACFGAAVESRASP